MKELIFFIGMVVMIAVTIEINERVKAKRNRNADKSESRNPEDCQKVQSGQEDCSGCGLVEICEKEEKKTGL